MPHPGQPAASQSRKIEFRVTLFTTRVAAPTMDETDQAILNALTERGLVRGIGTSPSDPRRRYYPAI
ncbi:MULTISPECIES: hypothetical protein [unclassified Frankia]|uniref:hypothetical protein n=1 Tax=unclassified Frankia TaxID=2632575 RepID=UPI002AD2D3C6|nr:MULTISPECIES: hypothetical protein [unclassified Frankia]